MSTPNKSSDPEMGQAESTTLTPEREEEVKEEVNKYTFYNRKLLDDANKNGDIYDKTSVAIIRRQWEIQDISEQPYLQHVKCLSATWPTLELLADFMEIGTSPMRWESLAGSVHQHLRDERTSRTEVTRLDYYPAGEISSSHYESSGALGVALNEVPSPTKKQPSFRLFIVEDLSRDVIELLGSKFDIEPHFFREHIFDYAWYNTRDRWSYPPRFNRLVRDQKWLQLRFTTARYFRTSNSFLTAVKQAENFNVYRRPDDDTNNRAIWDEKDAKVGISRARASFWKSNDVGVIIVDPTIQEGFPLWYGYGNWEQTPSMKEVTTPSGPPRKSFYADLIYWAQRPKSFGLDLDSPSNDIPMQALLSLVASEWLIISDYIKTRLGQIEWEISYPDHFLAKENNIDVPLKKLHIWRRLVPLYREMLNETLQGVFKLPVHTMGNSDLSANNPPSPSRVVASGSANDVSESMNTTKEEFTRTLSYMEEYQLRIDRLTSVVTAVISIADSRHSQEDNRNVARLTWLATFFIPLGFVASLFSMTDNVRSLSETYKWFAAAAIPLACISVGLGIVLTLPQVQKWRSGVTRTFDEWVELQKLKRKKD